MLILKEKNSPAQLMPGGKIKQPFQLKNESHESHLL